MILQSTSPSPKREKGGDTIAKTTTLAKGIASKKSKQPVAGTTIAAKKKPSIVAMSTAKKKKIAEMEAEVEIIIF